MKKLVLIAAISAVAIFGVMASANAANEVTISARVNSKIVVTAPADHVFAAVDPDAAPQTHTDDVNVRSNVDYTLSVADSGDTTFITDGGTILGDHLKAPSAGGVDHSETWTFDPAAGGDWADARDYTATFTYTAVITP